MNNQGPKNQKSDKTRKKKKDDFDQFNNKEIDQDQSCHGDGQVKNEKEGKEGYFVKNKGKKMTVVFHAVLAPHFKFEKDQGDRIFMRFGGVAFGDFNEDVVEVHQQR